MLEADAEKPKPAVEPVEEPADDTAEVVEPAPAVAATTEMQADSSISDPANSVVAAAALDAKLVGTQGKVTPFELTDDEDGDAAPIALAGQERAPLALAGDATPIVLPGDTTPIPPIGDTAPAVLPASQAQTPEQIAARHAAGDYSDWDKDFKASPSLEQAMRHDPDAAKELAPYDLYQQQKRAGDYSFVDRLTDEQFIQWAADASPEDKAGFGKYAASVAIGDYSFVDRLGPTNRDAWMAKTDETSFNSYWNFKERKDAGDYSYVDRMSESQKVDFLGSDYPQDIKGYENYQDNLKNGNMSYVDRMPPQAQMDWLMNSSDKQYGQYLNYRDKIANGDYSFVNGLNTDNLNDWLIKAPEAEWQGYQNYQNRIAAGDWSHVDKLNAENRSEFIGYSSDADFNAYINYKDKIAAGDYSFTEKLNDANYNDFIKNSTDAEFDAYLNFTERKAVGDYSYVDRLNDANKSDFILHSSTEDFIKYLDHTNRQTAGDYSNVDKLSNEAYADWFATATPEQVKGYLNYQDKVDAGDYSFLNGLNETNLASWQQGASPEQLQAAIDYSQRQNAPTEPVVTDGTVVTSGGTVIPGQPGPLTTDGGIAVPPVAPEIDPVSGLPRQGPQAVQALDAGGKPIGVAVDSTGKPIAVTLDTTGQPVKDAAGNPVPVAVDGNGKPITVTIDANGNKIATVDSGVAAVVPRASDAAVPVLPGDAGMVLPPSDTNVGSRAPKVVMGPDGKTPMLVPFNSPGVRLPASATENVIAKGPLTMTSPPQLDRQKLEELRLGTTTVPGAVSDTGKAPVVAPPVDANGKPLTAEQQKATIDQKLATITDPAEKAKYLASLSATPEWRAAATPYVSGLDAAGKKAFGEAQQATITEKLATMTDPAEKAKYLAGLSTSTEWRAAATTVASSLDAAGKRAYGEAVAEIRRPGATATNDGGAVPVQDGSRPKVPGGAADANAGNIPPVAGAVDANSRRAAIEQARAALLDPTNKSADNNVTSVQQRLTAAYGEVRDPAAVVKDPKANPGATTRTDVVPPVVGANGERTPIVPAVKADGTPTGPVGPVTREQLSKLTGEERVKALSSMSNDQLAQLGLSRTDVTNASAAATAAVVKVGLPAVLPGATGVDNNDPQKPRTGEIKPPVGSVDVRQPAADGSQPATEVKLPLTRQERLAQAQAAVNLATGAAVDTSAPPVVVVPKVLDRKESVQQKLADGTIGSAAVTLSATEQVNNLQTRSKDAAIVGHTQVDQTAVAAKVDLITHPEKVNTGGTVDVRPPVTDGKGAKDNSAPAAGTAVDTNPVVVKVPEPVKEAKSVTRADGEAVRLAAGVEQGQVQPAAPKVEKGPDKVVAAPGQAADPVAQLRAEREAIIKAAPAAEAAQQAQLQQQQQRLEVLRAAAQQDAQKVAIEKGSDADRARAQQLVQDLNRSSATVERALNPNARAGEVRPGEVRPGGEVKLGPDGKPVPVEGGKPPVAVGENGRPLTTAEQMRQEIQTRIANATTPQEVQKWEQAQRRMDALEKTTQLTDAAVNRGPVSAGANAGAVVPVGDRGAGVVGPGGKGGALLRDGVVEGMGSVALAGKDKPGMGPTGQPLPVGKGEIGVSMTSNVGPQGKEVVGVPRIDPVTGRPMLDAAGKPIMDIPGGGKHDGMTAVARDSAIPGPLPPGSRVEVAGRGEIGAVGQMRIDPVTGKLVEVGRIDPVTGKQIEVGRIDPLTGKPEVIAGKGEIGASRQAIDPTTGAVRGTIGLDGIPIGKFDAKGMPIGADGTVAKPGALVPGGTVLPGGTFIPGTTATGKVTADGTGIVAKDGTTATVPGATPLVNIPGFGQHPTGPNAAGMLPGGKQDPAGAAGLPGTGAPGVQMQAIQLPGVQITGAGGAAAGQQTVGQQQPGTANQTTNGPVTSGVSVTSQSSTAGGTAVPVVTGATGATSSVSGTVVTGMNFTSGSGAITTTGGVALSGVQLNATGGINIAGGSNVTGGVNVSGTVGGQGLPGATTNLPGTTTTATTNLAADPQGTVAVGQTNFAPPAGTQPTQDPKISVDPNGHRAVTASGAVISVDGNRNITADSSVYVDNRHQFAITEGGGVVIVDQNGRLQVLLEDLPPDTNTRTPGSVPGEQRTWRSPSGEDVNATSGHIISINDGTAIKWTGEPHIIVLGPTGEPVNDGHATTIVIDGDRPAGAGDNVFVVIDRNPNPTSGGDVVFVNPDHRPIESTSGTVVWVDQSGKTSGTTGQVYFTDPYGNPMVSDAKPVQQDTVVLGGQIVTQQPHPDTLPPDVLADIVNSVDHTANVDTPTQTQNPKPTVDQTVPVLDHNKPVLEQDKPVSTNPDMEYQKPLPHSDTYTTGQPVDHELPQKLPEPHYPEPHYVDQNQPVTPHYDPQIDPVTHYSPEHTDPVYHDPIVIRDNWPTANDSPLSYTQVPQYDAEFIGPQLDQSIIDMINARANTDPQTDFVPSSHDLAVSPSDSSQLGSYSGDGPTSSGFVSDTRSPLSEPGSMSGSLSESGHYTGDQPVESAFTPSDHHESVEHSYMEPPTAHPIENFDVVKPSEHVTDAVAHADAVQPDEIYPAKNDSAHTSTSFDPPAEPVVVNPANAEEAGFNIASQLVANAQDPTDPVPVAVPAPPPVILEDPPQPIFQPAAADVVPPADVAPATPQEDQVVAPTSDNMQPAQPVAREEEPPQPAISIPLPADVTTVGSAPLVELADPNIPGKLNTDAIIADMEDRTEVGKLMGSNYDWKVEEMEKYNDIDRERRERYELELSEKRRRDEESREDREQRELEERAKRFSDAMLAAMATKKTKAPLEDIEQALVPEIRQKYVVLQGDTLESIAIKKLRDKRLAPLLYEVNKHLIPARMQGDVRYLQLSARTVIQLPTQAEIRRFHARLFGRQSMRIQYEPATEACSTRATNPGLIRAGLLGAEIGKKEENADQAAKRRANVESMLGTVAKTEAPPADGRIRYICRLGDTLRSVAMRHPALKDVTLWKLLADVNGLTLDVDEKGAPLAQFKRGTTVSLPTVEEIEAFKQKLKPKTATTNNKADRITAPQPPYSVPSASDQSQATTIQNLQTDIDSQAVTQDPVSGGTVVICDSNSSDSVVNRTGNNVLPFVRPGDIIRYTPPGIALRDPGDATNSLLEAAGMTPRDVASAGDDRGVRNVIHHLTETCRIVNYGEQGGEGSGFRTRLEVRQEDFWRPVVQYEVNADVTLRHEFSVTGKRTTSRIDLPPHAAKELAENDITSHWEKYSCNFQSGRKIAE